MIQMLHYIRVHYRTNAQHTTDNHILDRVIITVILGLAGCRLPPLIACFLCNSRGDTIALFP